ncbi:hypothetical protein ACFCYN_07835 [Gottfriedia sp. NPDC056225]
MIWRPSAPCSTEQAAESIFWLATMTRGPKSGVFREGKRIDW